jgi:hypothetical protein
MVNVAQTHSLGCMPLFSSIYFILGHIFSPIKPNYFTNSSLALTRFWPWGVCGIVKELFNHGHSMVFPHIHTSHTCGNY